MRSIFTQIRLFSNVCPKQAAIILPDRIVTYEMLWAGIQSVQIKLAKLALNKAEPIGLLVDNPVRHLIVCLALVRSGFTVASLSVEHLGLTKSFNIRHVMTDLKNLSLASGAQYHDVEDDWFANKLTITLDEIEPPPHRIMRITFTSGSTGFPKAIGWSYRTIHRRMNDYSLSGVADSNRFLTTMGLSSGGLLLALKVINSGKTIIFAPQQFALELIQQYGVNEVHASSLQARLFLEDHHVKRIPLHLTKFIVTGGILSTTVADELKHRFRAEVIDILISTEAGQTGFASGDILELRRSAGHCFVPLVNVEIVDAAGNRLPPNEEGRLKIQSHMMGWSFEGNLDEEKITNGGWFFPGDTGFLNDRGLLVLTGRADDTVNLGGVKFAPERIEAHLAEHPHIIEAAVVRITNMSAETELWLAVVERNPLRLEEVNQWLAGRLVGELRSARIDRKVSLPDLPKNSMGKFNRPKILELCSRQ